jgi:Zn-dependent metalloprotease
MSIRTLNCIVPPHVLNQLRASSDSAVREAAFSTMLDTTLLRGQRSIRSLLLAAGSPAQGRRTVFDCRNSTNLASAVLARSEDGTASDDVSVNQAFDGLGSTRQFFSEVLERNSIDDRGMRLDGYVHRGVRYNNAFWDGREMVFGDGDGRIFGDFTGSLDVIGHELAHGVTEYTANLEYHVQSGALNESMSDVFGSLVKQWVQQQTADQADWLIGADIFTPGVDADALRSLSRPGEAYDNAQLGKDPQPAHMRDFVELPDTEEGDNGGVHINSGIPNKAFFLTATAIGGYAWEAPGHIWYEALRASTPTTDFQAFADTTSGKAGELFGQGSAEQDAVVTAWRDVGITVAGTSTPPYDADALGELTRQVAELAHQVQALAQEVHGKAPAKENGKAPAKGKGSRSGSARG